MLAGFKAIPVLQPPTLNKSLCRRIQGTSPHLIRLVQVVWNCQQESDLFGVPLVRDGMIYDITG